MTGSVCRTALKLAVLVGIGLIAVHALAQTPEVESDVKAAFVFNFPKFVDWPPGLLNKSPAFVICVVDDSLFPSLQRLVRNETIAGKPLRVEKRSATMAGCHVLFISAQAPQVIISTVDKLPVLTIGEDPSFLRNGGMIRLTKVNNRVRFEINQPAAERAGLHVSSRLLRLADAVVQPPE